MLIPLDDQHNQIAGEPCNVVQEIAHRFAVRRLEKYTVHSPLMTWSTEDIMVALYIAVAVMLIVALYHVIFIVVDLRKIMRRLNDVTEEVETVIMKPLSMTDQALEWLVNFFQEKAEKHHKKHLDK